MRLVAAVGAIALAVSVSAGDAAQPKEPFRFQATAPPTLRIGAPALVLRVRSTEPAALTVTLYRSGAKLETWREVVGLDRRRVRLPLKATSRRLGRYTLLLAATAAGETVFRTLRYRVVAPVPG